MTHVFAIGMSDMKIRVHGEITGMLTGEIATLGQVRSHVVRSVADNIYSVIDKKKKLFVPERSYHDFFFV